MKGQALQLPVLLFKTGFPLMSTEPSPVYKLLLPLYKEQKWRVNSCNLNIKIQGPDHFNERCSIKYKLTQKKSIL